MLQMILIQRGGHNYSVIKRSETADSVLVQPGEQIDVDHVHVLFRDMCSW